MAMFCKLLRVGWEVKHHTNIISSLVSTLYQCEDISFKALCLLIYECRDRTGAA